MIRNERKISNNGIEHIGIFLFCIYNATLFFANDVLLPKEISSYSLYLFLGCSVLFLFMKRTLQLQRVSVWMLSVMAFSMISMLYSPEKGILSGKFYLLIVNFVIVMLISQYSFNKNIVAAIGWTYAMSSLFMMVSLIATGNITDLSESGRLGTELTGNANSFASLLMIAVLFAIWFLIYTKRNIWQTILLLSSIAMSYFGMFLSGGRKYVIIPIIFLYVLLLFKRDKKGRAHLLKNTISVILAVCLVYWLMMNVPMFYEIIGIRIEAGLSFLQGDLSKADASSILRDKMIEGGLKGWLSSPIWGHGFDSFKHYNVTITGLSTYSHNNYVEMLFNTGIIGFFLYYSFYVYILKKALTSKQKVSMSSRAFASAFIVAMVFYEYGQVNYTITSTMVLLYLASAMLRPQQIEQND